MEIRVGRQRAGSYEEREREEKIKLLSVNNWSRCLPFSDDNDYDQEFQNFSFLDCGLESTCGHM